MTKSQHGFVTRRFVQTNMLLFLKRRLEALDHDPQSEIISFYSDFLKMFDNVYRYELIPSWLTLDLVDVCLK